MGRQAGSSGQSQDRLDQGYERSDVPAMLPFWLACLLIGFLGSVLIGITLGFGLADFQEFRGPTQRLPPAPRLQLAPEADLQGYERDEQRRLSGSNSASAPAIESAMRQTAKQGWGAPE